MGPAGEGTSDQAGSRRNSDATGSVVGGVLVEIWSDVVCPWCYIGKRRFEAALAQFERADEVEVRWRSFELDPNAPSRRSASMAEHLAAKYATTVQEARTRLQSLDQLAAAEGLHYDLANTKGGNTLAAHRLIHLGYSKDVTTGSALKEAALHAYFEDLLEIGDPEVLLEVGVKAGLEYDEVSRVLESERFTQEVRRDEADAAALGCTGVPFFVFDRAFAVPGAQSPETLLAALRTAWDRSHPVMETVNGDASVCTADSCGL